MRRRTTLLSASVVAVAVGAIRHHFARHAEIGEGLWQWPDLYSGKFTLFDPEITERIYQRSLALVTLIWVGLVFLAASLLLGVLLGKRLS